MVCPSLVKRAAFAAAVITVWVVADSGPAVAGSDIAVRETNPRIVDGDILLRAQRWEASVVNDMRWAGSQNSLLDVDTLTSPGMLVGITSYDLQHNSTQGHDVAANTGGTVHMIWTYWDRIPQAANEKDRFVRYNSWNGSTFDHGFDGAVIYSAVGRVRGICA